MLVYIIVVYRDPEGYASLAALLADYAPFSKQRTSELWADRQPESFCGH